MQTFHRHQVPDASYKVYDQFKDESGKPIYPQLPFLIALFIAQGGGQQPVVDSFANGEKSDVWLKWRRYIHLINRVSISR